MAVTLTLSDVDPGTTQLYAFGTVALSGTYPSGGDTIDWTQLAKQITVRGQTVDSSMTDPRTDRSKPASRCKAELPSQYKCSREPRPIIGRCADTRQDPAAPNSPAARPIRVRQRPM